MKTSTVLWLAGGFCLAQLGSVSCTSKSPDSSQTTERNPRAFLADDTPADDAPRSTASNQVGNFVWAAKAATPAVVHIKTT